MQVHIHVSIYASVFKDILMRIFLFARKNIHIKVNVLMYTYIHSYINVNIMYIYAYIYIYVNKHLTTNMFMHI
jgi:hypothetical protein